MQQLIKSYPQAKLLVSWYYKYMEQEGEDGNKAPVVWKNCIAMTTKSFLHEKNWYAA